MRYCARHRWTRAVNEITSSALTKAFLNCNELPKSELCAVQVPSSPPRRETPSYKTPPYTRIYIHIYIYPGIPVAALGPPHVMNIFTLIGRLGIFHLARRCVGWNRSVSIPSILYLYRQDVSVFLRAVRSRAPLHAVFIGNSRMSDEPESDANDPFVLARKSLEFRQDSSSGRQYSRDNMYRVREPLGIKVRHAQEI